MVQHKFVLEMESVVLPEVLKVLRKEFLIEEDDVDIDIREKECPYWDNKDYFRNLEVWIKGKGVIEGFSFFWREQGKEEKTLFSPELRTGFTTTGELLEKIKEELQEEGFNKRQLQRKFKKELKRREKDYAPDGDGFFRAKEEFERLSSAQ